MATRANLSDDEFEEYAREMQAHWKGVGDSLRMQRLHKVDPVVDIRTKGDAEPTPDFIVSERLIREDSARGGPAPV